MMKKIFALIAVFIVVSSFSSVHALTTLHETMKQETLSSGAILKTYKRFTDKGWLSINIVEVDLNDNNTNVSLLNADMGLNKFQTVYQMANKDNIIAAINGDFFNGTSKNGNTIGLSISDGKLLTSTYYENEVKDTFGSFILSDDNEAFFDYFTNKITLKSKKDNSEISIGEINKLSSDYTYPVLYTREWGEKSLGSSGDFIITEILVENNKVKEIRENGDAFEIPEDGFVIVTYGASAEYIKENFKIGTKIELDIDIGIDIEKVKMAVSGGAMLVENGTVPEKFASNISGSNPRTAIGLSKDSETLYLITVDGRQVSSIGMTQTELAEFLIEKGIYNALNLDGGGSTTMVARSLGEEVIKTVNSPSGGSLRMVTNAIGVYNSSKTSSLLELIIKNPEDNVFVNSSMKLEISGYDKYYNPVEVDEDNIIWSCSGADAKVVDGILYAGNEAGSVTVTAKKGKVTASKVIDILSAPNELEISPKRSAISLGEEVEFSIIAKNKNGYYATLQDEDLTFKVVSGDGDFSGDSYIAASEGEHIISISAGNAISYALITVGETNEDIIDSFESQDFKFVSYPLNVEGEADITKVESFSGKHSAKLEYDFTSTDLTRAAYLRFDNPIEVSENIETIKLWAYSDTKLNEQIKLKLIDAKGVTHLETLTKGLNSKEWTELSLDLNNISLPARLTDIYVAQDNSEIKNKGEVYFDKLMFIKQNEIEISDVVIPRDIKGEDVSNKPTNYTKDDSLKIAIYDEIGIQKTLLDQLVKNKIINDINNEAEAVILINQNNKDLTNNISADKIYNKGYEKIEKENTLIINLDVSNGGIRLTDTSEWLNLKNDIKNSSSKNIIINMNGSLNEFKDKMERQLFIDVMCEMRRSTVKNIWIISKGEDTNYSMERGIKYLTVNNKYFDTTDPLNVAQNTKYILITVSNDEMSYEIKKIF